MKTKTILFFLLCSLFFSCKKDNDVSTPTSDELLTKSPWKLNEIRYSQVNTSGGGATYYYKRGVTGNLGNFDNTSVLFASNNTGTYTLGSTTSPITWQFVNPEKTKIQ